MECYGCCDLAVGDALTQVLFTFELAFRVAAFGLGPSEENIALAHGNSVSSDFNHFVPADCGSRLTIKRIGVNHLFIWLHNHHHLRVQGGVSNGFLHGGWQPYFARSSPSPLH